MLRPDPDKPGWRLCLGGCDRLFLSANAGHRICPKCTRNTNNQHQPRPASNTVYVGGSSHTLTPDD